MSTIADYSILTKAFLASKDVNFSNPYTNLEGEGERAFAVVPLTLNPRLTTREALHFDPSKLDAGGMWNHVSCRDADGKFIGNVVRIQPDVREGSIRLVAKVAVPAAIEGDVTDISVNTFVLLRTNSEATDVLPIAVATISAGYTLHTHLTTNRYDPLDDVENANYVSFTINNLNGYTSVDFNPDAYATYDDVADALSRGIDGLHIAFDTASGDLKLLDKDGNVLDQANLPIKADVIIAEGEEGYKYVKTDVKQDIHAAKAWMPEGSTAWDPVEAVPYTRKHAALVVGKGSTPASRVFVDSVDHTEHTISTESVTIAYVEISGSTYMVADIQEGLCSLFKIKGDSETRLYQGCKYAGESVALPADGSQCPISNGSVEQVDVIKHDGNTYVLGEMEPQTFQPLTLNGERSGNTGTIVTSEGSSTGKVLGITTDGTNLYTFDENAETPSMIQNISGGDVRWLDIKPLTEVPSHTLKYGLEAFVWTVKDTEAGNKISDPFFQQLNASLLALGFHEGDDIALGTNIAELSTKLNGVDADEYIHGKGNKATREQEVDEQRKFAKEELVAWNAQHPALTSNRQHGTIIDSSGLDIRSGSITLGCGRVGKDNDRQKVNYGIQMKDRPLDPIRSRSESLDFTISQRTGAAEFDANGHATGLTSSTLLSIESGSYISGAPTCLILAEVTCTESGTPVFTPVRMTAGFSVSSNYETPGGLSLTIHDYRDNIIAILNPGGSVESAPVIPAIIEVQALYTHLNAETVPAQQMHTYIGKWMYNSDGGVQMDHPECSFLCNKIEDWMTSVGLTDAQNQGSELYVVLRVY